MSKDKLDEAMDLVYDWKVNEKNGKIDPSTVRHTLPKFVRNRLNWLRKESQVNPGLTYTGSLLMMLGTQKDEKELKDDWDMGAASDYLPFSEEYKEWIDDPFCSNARQMAIALALIFGFKDDDDESN